jgi:non-ribosomal peptide synthetase component F
MTNPRANESGRLAVPGGPEPGLMAQFEARAAAHPDALAVSDGERRLSYRDLDTSASRLAQEILQRIGPGTSPVCLMLGHDVNAIVGLVAVLKAGHPYLALRPSDPPQRVQTILDDAQPALTISARRFAPQLRELHGPAGALASLYLEDIDFSGALAHPAVPVSPTRRFASSTPPAQRASPRASSCRTGLMASVRRNRARHIRVRRSARPHRSAQLRSFIPQHRRAAHQRRRGVHVRLRRKRAGTDT